MAGMFSDADAFEQNLGRWYVVPADTAFDAADASLNVTTISAQNAFLDGHNPAYGTGSGHAVSTRTLFNMTGSTLMFKGAPDPGDYMVSVTASGDGVFSNGNNRHVLDVTVTGSANSLPEVEAGADQTVAEGSTVTLSGAATDDDLEDDLTYLWTHDSALPITFGDDSALGTSFTAPNVSEDTVVQFTLTVNDGTATVSDVVLVTITDSANAAPTVNAGADQTVAEGSTVTLSGAATDDDLEDDLTYLWTHDGALGITFADSAALSTSFTAPNVAADTTITVTLTVNDGTATVSDVVLVTITDSANVAPTVNAGADQTVAEGSTVTLSGTATDADPGDALTYEWTHDSALAIIIAGSDSLYTSFAAPDVAADTTFTVTLTVNDGTVGVSDTLQVTITDSPNSPPEVTAGADQTVAEGSTVSLSGTATDADPEDTRTYEWTHDSALAITIAGSDSLSASFAAPDIAADTTITVTLTVSDGTVGVSDTLQVTITDSAAIPPGTNSPPTVNVGQDRTVSEGEPVSLPWSASDDDGDPLTYAWSQSPAVPAIAFASPGSSPTTFTAPRVDSDTLFTLTLTANDGTGDGADSLRLTVRDSGSSSGGSSSGGSSSGGSSSGGSSSGGSSSGGGGGRAPAAIITDVRIYSVSWDCAAGSVAVTAGPDTDQLGEHKDELGRRAARRPGGWRAARNPILHVGHCRRRRVRRGGGEPRARGRPCDNEDSQSEAVRRNRRL